MNDISVKKNAALPLDQRPVPSSGAPLLTKVSQRQRGYHHVLPLERSRVSPSAEAGTDPPIVS